MRELKKLQACFYATDSGKEPAREWLKGLDAKDRKIIGQDISDVELGWPIGMPVCRRLEKGLYEVRSNLSGKRIARVIFYPTKENIILLNGFIKKTQKTPKAELELARTRKKEVEKNGKGK